MTNLMTRRTISVFEHLKREGAGAHITLNALRDAIAVTVGGDPRTLKSYTNHIQRLKLLAPYTQGGFIVDWERIWKLRDELNQPKGGEAHGDD